MTAYEASLGTFRRKLHFEPETKLMLAVLEDAIACFQKYAFAPDRKGKGAFPRGRVLGSRHKQRLAVFVANVCETLGFDPDYLRQGLAQWKATKLESRAKAKIYQVAQRNGKRKTGIAVTGRARHGLRRVASRCLSGRLHPSHEQ
jgi:hypothetical protein